MGMLLFAAFGESKPSNLPDDEGSKHLWNGGKLVPDYKAQQPRRQPSSLRNLLVDFRNINTDFKLNNEDNFAGWTQLT
jgi:hypothetical protein